MIQTVVRIVIAALTIVMGLYAGRMISRAPGETAAMLVCVFAALLSLAFVLRNKEDRQFVVGLWLGALTIRVVAAFVILVMGLQNRIAPDWFTYDVFGFELTRFWNGEAVSTWLSTPEAQYRSGWGMYYFVGAIYWLIGRNPFAIQLINCVISANACVLIYLTAQLAYSVRRVSRTAGILCAVAPSMVIWTSQGIKEPLLVFLLAAILYLTLRLSNKIRLLDVVLLVFALGAVYSLRHYVFFVTFVTSAAVLLLGARKLSTARVIQGGVVVIILASAFAYYGAGDVANKSFNLETIQSGRVWSARVTGSGYGGDVDITDTRAAIEYLPLGAIYFLFAPLPWMIRNFNHLVLLPEMVVWWAATPWLIKGFWFAVRRRLRASLGLVLFTVGLTIAYALFLTNFGTAHRMRVQILGFFIIFISVGWELRRMKSEGRKKRSGIVVYRRPIGAAQARVAE